MFRLAGLPFIRARIRASAPPRTGNVLDRPHPGRVPFCQPEPIRCGPAADAGNSYDARDRPGSCLLVAKIAGCVQNNDGDRTPGAGNLRSSRAVWLITAPPLTFLGRAR